MKDFRKVIVYCTLIIICLIVHCLYATLTQRKIEKTTVERKENHTGNKPLIATPYKRYMGNHILQCNQDLKKKKITIIKKK